MHPVVFTLTLDAVRPYGSQPMEVNLVQEDRNVHRLRLRVRNGTGEMDYGAFTEARVIFTRPDGVRVLGRAELTGEGIVYDVGTTELAVPGRVTAAVQMWNGEESRLTTSSFSFVVDPDPLALSAVESTSELPELTALLKRVEASASSIEEWLEKIDHNEIGAALEPATHDTLGAVKVGQGLSVAQDGTLSALWSEAESADVGFFAPKEVLTAEGKPVELYSRQIFRAMNAGDYEVYFRGKGATNANKWSYTPKAGDAVSTISAEVYDRAGHLTHKQNITLSPVAPQAQGMPLRLMLIGDSLSNPTVTAKHLGAAIRQFSRQMAGSDTDVLTMVGTRGTVPENHEAFGGSQIQHFLTATEANSFWDADTGRTNFAAYTARTGIQPDIVHIMLGTNNVRNISGEDQAAHAAQIKGFIDNMEILLSLMRADWPQAVILVGLPPYLAPENSAGTNYRQFRMDRNFQAYCKGLYERVGEAFGGDEKMFTVPHNVLMDRMYGYEWTKAPANPYTEATAEIVADPVHPGQAGQRQMALAIVNAWAPHAQTGGGGGGGEGGDRATVTNMLSNPGFDGTAGWAVLANTFVGSASGGILTQTGKIGGGATANSSLYQEGVPFPMGHVIYLRATTRTSAGEAADYRRRQLMSDNSVGVVAEETDKTTDWSTLSGIFTAIEASNRFQVRQGRTASVAWDGETIDHKEPLAVDLTAAFGAGNEPDKAWCDANIPYFQGTITI